MERLLYRFRPGALDAIMRTRNLTTEDQLASAIGVTRDGLKALREGACLTVRGALRVAAMQGDAEYLSGWFDLVEPQPVAA